MAYTTIDDPSAYFQTKLYTGTGSSLAITNDGNSNLQPDLVWLKRRDGSTYDHRWNDSVRGVSKTIYSSDNFAENTSDAQVVTSFDSNGFTLGTSAGSNASGVNNVAWQWKASGSTASNTDGSITSTVSANTTAGFSIVSWTGTGANATIGHGLGAEPKMIFLKIRTGTNNWQVYNKSIGSGNALFLNTTDASGSNTGWQSTDATSSVFYVSGGTAVNGSGASLIAYCFAEKKGYSKIGSYTGNGNADGTFIYTGFKPAWVMIKNSSHARDWIMMDNKRDPDNVVSNRLFPNNTDAQNTNNDMLDFTSNGFKIRNTNTTANLNGGTYIYMAFAESPFVTGASAIPTTAR